MFRAVELEIRDRLRQSKEILNLIADLENTENSRDIYLAKIQKGYLFVSLYSSLEYTVANTVLRFLELLQQDPKKPMEYRKYILCTVLNAKFNALQNCSKKNIWDKKSELFDELFSTDNVDIDDSVFPSDGVNISHKQIQDIWKFFHLSGNDLPAGVNSWVIQEIKNHRNAIAHGREKAADIGGRYSTTVLLGKAENIEQVCFHVLEAFNTSFNNQSYLYMGSA